MASLSEAEIEMALLDQLRTLGYSIEREEDIGPDGHRPERESHDEVLLRRRFKDAVDCLISGAPRIADAQAFLKERDL
jgi:type I restriction enzyme R subunit